MLEPVLVNHLFRVPVLHLGKVSYEIEPFLAVVVFDEYRYVNQSVGND